MAGQGSADNELLPGEVDVAPAHRHELPAAEAGIGRYAHQLRVLGVVTCASGCFFLADGETTRIAVCAGGKRLCKRFDLLR